MATKWKNTDAFKGVVSWVCLLICLCAVSVGVLCLLVLVLNPVALENFTGMLEYVERYKEIPYEVLVPAISILVLFLVSVVLIFAFRQDRRQFEDALAVALSKVWVEIKLLAIFGFALLFSADLAFFLPAGVVMLYFLCLDIGHNKRFFGNNIIRSILIKANTFKTLPTYEKRSMRRLLSTLGVIAGIVILSSFALFAIVFNSSAVSIVYNPLLLSLCVGIPLFALIGVVGTVCWYVLAQHKDLQDCSALMAQITEMYNGNLNAVNHVPPTSNLYDSAMQLNMIRTGIQKAVEEGTKADRTKVELITNVSHDIKTPLTSIVSYVGLLQKEPDLPPHVMDYINTIAAKSARLSSIVQDVFEVSKAATGNITLNPEDLDMGKLLRQTFAEMDETLQASRLTWRVEIPENPVLVHADGQRLYRVFQNLIRNCAQYSLEGSRVYVQLTEADGMARVSLRNVSKNEITMNSDDLTARFVRGDQTRTTEGSGLGLSIAKSFTEACGGVFTVNADSDIFLVTVSFPLLPPVLDATQVPAEETQPPEEAPTQE